MSVLARKLSLQHINAAALDAFDDDDNDDDDDDEEEARSAPGRCRIIRPEEKALAAVEDSGATGKGIRGRRRVLYPVRIAASNGVNRPAPAQNLKASPAAKNCAAVPRGRSASPASPSPVSPRRCFAGSRPLWLELIVDWIEFRGVGTLPSTNFLLRVFFSHFFLVLLARCLFMDLPGAVFYFTFLFYELHVSDSHCDSFSGSIAFVFIRTKNVCGYGQLIRRNKMTTNKRVTSFRSGRKAKQKRKGVHKVLKSPVSRGNI